MRNGWLAFSLLAAACVGAAARPVIFPVAGAAAPTERCDWRTLKTFNVPKGAENEPMGEDWSALSDAGYHVAATSGALTVFERCAPAR